MFLALSNDSPIFTKSSLKPLTLSYKFSAAFTTSSMFFACLSNLQELSMALRDTRSVDGETNTLSF